jgi:hypothetical protein
MSNVVFAVICAVIALFSALQSRPHPSEIDSTEQVEAEDSFTDGEDGSHT